MVLAGYQKLKVVGKGTFGTATLYKRLADNKMVVLKDICTNDMDFVEKKSALKELEIISSLNHPNIIRYMGSLEKDGTIFIEMEYAEGGNLAQLITLKKNRNDTFKEKGILRIMYETTGATSYMHSKKIIHRDLKAANIFISSNGALKVGDFGISKMLNTKSQAQTIVGTPYYLSPEMCEGSDYNEKSDIWALGCIFYELAILKKPFSAQTLPVLVQKIVECQYEEIPEIYCPDLVNSIYLILQKNVHKRPSAKMLHEIILPDIFRKYSINIREESCGDTYSNSIPRRRSVLYTMKNFTDEGILLAVELPCMRIVDFSLSDTHYIAVTIDNTVYTWGNNKYGQLGIKQNETDLFKNYPISVDQLRNKNIVKCAAGFNFSLFLSKTGEVYACGQTENGCLGLGKSTNNVRTPALIYSLCDIPISQIACGSCHVIALSKEGSVYVWGSCKHGEMGLGQNMLKRDTPTLVNTVSQKIKKIFCLSNATVLISSNSTLFVCGSSKGVENINHFVILRHNHGKISDVSLSKVHTLLVNETGEVLVMGKYDQVEGQNGKISKNGCKIVQIQNRVIMSTCSSTFSAVVDNKNVLWFWGAYKKLPNTSGSNDILGNTTEKNMNYHSTKSLFEGQSSIAVFESFSNLNNAEFVKLENPKPILALFSSNKNVESGNFIKFISIKAKENSLMILVDTTCPTSFNNFSNSEVNDGHGTNELRADPIFLRNIRVNYQYGVGSKADFVGSSHFEASLLYGLNMELIKQELRGRTKKKYKRKLPLGDGNRANFFGSSYLMTQFIKRFENKIEKVMACRVFVWHAN